MNTVAPVGIRPSRSRSVRMDRSRRRIRFRSTAPPTLRGMVNATRGNSPSGSGRCRRRSSVVRTWIPDRRTAAKVARSEIPCIKQPACVGPCAGDCSRFRGRPWWTYGCETRASSLACEHSAGTCASSDSPVSGRRRCLPGVSVARVVEEGRTRCPRRERSASHARVRAGPVATVRPCRRGRKNRAKLPDQRSRESSRPSKHPVSRAYPQVLAPRRG